MRGRLQLQATGGAGVQRVPPIQKIDDEITRRARAVLKSVFGYDEFRGHQEAAIAAAIAGPFGMPGPQPPAGEACSSSFQPPARLALPAGRDCLVLLPTGGGKSMCYTLPALLLPPPHLVLVVSPLIALMQDQVAALQARGVAATCLCSSLNTASRNAVQTCLENNLDASHLGALRINSGSISRSQHAQHQVGGPGSTALGTPGSTLRMLYVTPEGLATDSLQRLLSLLHNRKQLGLLAVDEAHCISEYGQDFRPAYRRLATLRSLLPGLPFMALTATATLQVQQDICRSLRLDAPVVLAASFNRPNIAYSTTLLDVAAHMQRQQRSEGPACTASLGGIRSNVGSSGHGVGDGSDEEGPVQGLVRQPDVDAIALRHLGALLSQHLQLVEGPAKRPPQGCALVYVHRRADAATVVGALTRLPATSRLRSAMYHAGLPDRDRAAVLAAWVARELDVVAATVAFGMGIDRPDVRLVVHWCVPKSLEAYYQESGRAGRDGRPAHAALLYRMDDRARLEFILRKDQERGAKRRKLAAGDGSASWSQPGDQSSAPPSGWAAFSAVVEYATSTACRRARLLAHFGETLPHGSCQGCDACSDAQGVAAAASLLDFLQQQQSSSLHASGRAMVARASGAWRARPPEGTYGLDQISDSSGDEEDRGKGDEDGDQCLVADPEAAAAQDAAAHALRVHMAGHAGSRPTYGGPIGGGMDSLAYLEEMRRREEGLGRTAGQGSGADVFARIASRNSSAAGGAADGVPDAMRASARMTLAADMGRAAGCQGLEPALLSHVASALEAGLAEGGVSKARYKARFAQVAGRCKSCASITQLWDLLPVEGIVHGGGGARPLTLTALLDADVAAVSSLSAGALASEQAGLGRGVGALRKSRHAAIEGAARQVVSQWKARLGLDK